MGVINKGKNLGSSTILCGLRKRRVLGSLTEIIICPTMDL